LHCGVFSLIVFIQGDFLFLGHQGGVNLTKRVAKAQKAKKKGFFWEKGNGEGNPEKG